MAVLEVKPKRAAIESNVDFVLRVHSVRPGTYTQAVKIRFPEEISGGTIGAPPLGWSMRPIKNDGTVGVRFSGGAIPSGTHQDFLIRARTVAAGRALFTAEQFYANGEVVSFDLAPGTAGDRDEGPGAVVQIVGPTTAPAPSAPPAPASPQGPAEEAVPASEPFAVVSANDGDGVLLRGFGLVLLLVALGAFVAVLVLILTGKDETVERVA
jgi:uncharacterized protein YcnI